MYINHTHFTSLPVDLWSFPLNFSGKRNAANRRLRNLNMNFGVRLAFDKGQATGPFVCGRENITTKDGTTAGPLAATERKGREDLNGMRWASETGDTRNWFVNRSWKPDPWPTTHYSMGTEMKREMVIGWVRCVFISQNWQWMQQPVAVIVPLTTPKSSEEMGKAWQGKVYRNRNIGRAGFSLWLGYNIQIIKYITLCKTIFCPGYVKSNHRTTFSNSIDTKTHFSCGRLEWLPWSSEA